MKFISTLHERYVFGRRVQVLAGHLAALLPQQARVLDVGCGDGNIDCVIKQLRPDVMIEGIDVLVRPTTRIPVHPFDGYRIPFNDSSFDVVMFVDVLHHTDDPQILLAEAQRVAKQAIVLKDHLREGLLAGPTLRLMDWFGNAHHGVVLPYNYWPEQRWRDSFSALGISIERWIAHVGLYPWPASLLFDRRLHYVARLKPSH
ncbi:MAG: class I SAM-dependent methyltransferase [Candidatus Competibacteraceae bacterium]|jgi:SAM-dependent methyltransferase|nr:class I SAM-dependent methyltransferase [Candidatus Competibacteraceae bacterium]